MNKFYLLIFMLIPFYLLPQNSMEKNYQSFYSLQTNIALNAKLRGDWLTLIRIAKQSYTQQQDVLWREGLIKWAEEMILYKRPVAGARHLSGYYFFIQDRNKGFYWKSVADFWEKNIKKL